VCESIISSKKKHQASAQYLARKKQRELAKEIRDRATATAAAEAEAAEAERLKALQEGQQQQGGEGAADAALIQPGVAVVVGAPLLPELLRDDEQFQLLLSVRAFGIARWCRSLKTRRRLFDIAGCLLKPTHGRPTTALRDDRWMVVGGSSINLSPW
jgi:hypothetical protein